MSKRSIPELTLEVVDAGLDLVRTEVAIVREDIARTVAARATGVGLLLGAAIVGLIALVFLTVALFYGLASVMANGWAALVTALVVLALAGLLAALGVGRLRGGANG